MDNGAPVLYPQLGLSFSSQPKTKHLTYSGFYTTAPGDSSYKQRLENPSTFTEFREAEPQNPEETAVVCPVCFTHSPEQFNWCSTCGELLIGANFCSSGDLKCDSNGLSFNMNQTTQPSDFLCNNEYYSDICNGSGLQLDPRFSCNNNVQYSTFISYPHQSILSIAPELSFASTSFVTSPTFSSANLKTQCSNCNEYSITSQDQVNHSYRVAERSVPLSSNTEATHTGFEEFRFANVPTVSVGALQYVDPSTEEYTTSYMTNCDSGSRGIAFSYPRTDGLVEHKHCNFENFSANSISILNPRTVCQITEGRQRCTSGPDKQLKATMTQGRIPNLYQTDRLASCYQSASCSSPISSPAEFLSRDANCACNDWRDSVSHIDEVNQFISHNFANLEALDCVRGCHRSMHYSSGHQSTEKGTRFRSNVCRRKHPSECSRMCLRQITPVMDSNLHRAHSFSSDFQEMDLNAAVFSRNHAHPHSNWQSARMAWSARDPALLNKKPAAYFRASYCQKGAAIDRHEPRNCSKHQTGDHSKLDSSYRNHYNKQQHSNFVITKETSVEPDKLNMVNNSTLSSQPEKQNDVDVNNRQFRHQRPDLNKRNPGAVKLRNSTVPLVTGSEIKVHNLDSKDNCIDDVDKTRFHKNEQNTFPNWMLLPDELWLAILRPLSILDRAHIAQTCHNLSRLTMDRSLWQVVHLHRQHHLTDSALLRIANFKPKELRFTYCRGDSLTAGGLKRMFAICGSGLQKLALIGCTKGPFDQDLPLRLVANHCHNLKHVNVSYTLSVRDQTVIALVKSAAHLISVKLNGAQKISNTAIQQLVNYHDQTLEKLELFGCFRLNSNIFALLGRCQKLKALAFGHLHHLSSDGLLELVSKLPHLSSLDLRGTQTLGDDNNLPELAAKCPHLEEVVLANMHSLKQETGIAQMLRCLPRLRVLDLCGLAAVGDLTMEVLSTSCSKLEQLDVSCTSVTQKGLSHLITAPIACLRCLRISHCREITKDVLEKLVHACPKLNLIYAYGFTTIKDWSFLQEIRPTLLVESGI